MSTTEIQFYLKRWAELHGINYCDINADILKLKLNDFPRFTKVSPDSQPKQGPIIAQTTPLKSKQSYYLNVESKQVVPSNLRNRS